MKVTSVDVLSCEGGWRTLNFLKVETDEGITGYSECNCVRSHDMLRAAIQYLGGLIVGKNPFQTEKIQVELYHATQRQLGGVAHQAISGIDAALLDIKGKALGVPVYEFFGGVVQDRIRVYYTHCGRAEPFHPDVPPVKSVGDIPACADYVKGLGFRDVKLNYPLTPEDRGDITPGTLNGIVEWIGAWQDALGAECSTALDVAFSFKMAGISKLARALEPFNMLWLEAETLDPLALKAVRNGTSTPICIGESFYRTQGFKPYLEAHALDIIMPDTVWNGITMGKKVADYANTYDILFAPHNSHGVLGGRQAVHLCATCENFKILEYEYDDVPWRNEIVTNPIQIKDGFIELSDQPGLGCDIVEEAIGAHPPE
ncbi:MAG: mandelate racemase/muconate lactonizing enzyme family protein [bacterium]|nr:mandelate racemase/muconate lactonizing enzyme family protein [bacterium]